MESVIVQKPLRGLFLLRVPSVLRTIQCLIVLLSHLQLVVLPIDATSRRQLITLPVQRKTIVNERGNEEVFENFPSRGILQVGQNADAVLGPERGTSLSSPNNEEDIKTENLLEEVSTLKLELEALTDKKVASKLDSEHPSSTNGASEAPEVKSFVFPDPYVLGPKIKDWDEQREDWLAANPHMRRKSNGKPRVLIVTGSQPKPCPSPTGDHFHIKSFKLKIDYARMHGYEIYYSLSWLDPLLGGEWVKLPNVRKLMLTHPEIEWIFWIDSDAVFTDMLFAPPFHTYDGYNMVMWGWEDGAYRQRNWVAINAGVFMMRNCQWSLDLIDKWSAMGPKGPVRDEYGRILSAFLDRGRNTPADDQSALLYLMLKDEAVGSKVKLVDTDEYAISYWWVPVVSTYEEKMEKYHPGLGDKRWPWITHFTGCGPCSGNSNPRFSTYEQCMANFTRAYNFADNQVLAYMGLQHESLLSTDLIRTRDDTHRPIDLVGVNPWEERIALVRSSSRRERDGF